MEKRVRKENKVHKKEIHNVQRAQHRLKQELERTKDGLARTKKAHDYAEQHLTLVQEAQKHTKAELIRTTEKLILAERELECFRKDPKRRKTEHQESDMPKTAAPAKPDGLTKDTAINVDAPDTDTAAQKSADGDKDVPVTAEVSVQAVLAQDTPWEEKAAGKSLHSPSTHYADVHVTTDFCKLLDIDPVTYHCWDRDPTPGSFSCSAFFTNAPEIADSCVPIGTQSEIGSKTEAIEKCAEEVAFYLIAKILSQKHKRATA